MQFNILGPLEVVDPDRLVRGVKQRATLGFLLLHANRVIPTSQLLTAVWGVDGPATARNMLHNAVSGLRDVLALDGTAEDSALLVTHTPGYILRVEPECVDLFRFLDLAEKGRAELAAGMYEQVSTRLREALALWRGPILADLAETGLNWPGLTSAQHARLSTLEDYFAAELACGHHREVVRELEALNEVEQSRERLCGQLMRALYRCGRQEDALNVYRRTRSGLLEKLGLDPGRELQELERAILSHDPALDMPPIGMAGRTARSTDERPADVLQREYPRTDEFAPTLAESRSDYTLSTSEAANGNVQPSRPERAIKAPAGVDTPQRAVSDELDVTGVPDELFVELKQITVVVVMAQMEEEREAGDLEDLERTMQSFSAMMHCEVMHFGGIMGGNVGAVSSAIFGVPRTREDDADRAICAALAIRARLEPRDAPAEGKVSQPRFSFRIAVATGEALVTYKGDRQEISSVATGAVVDGCMRLLELLPPGRVRICSATREASEVTDSYPAIRTASGAWDLAVVDSMPVSIASMQGPTGPFLEREPELDLMRTLFDYVRQWQQPHMVTVLGEVGIGKTRLTNEFARTLGDHNLQDRCLIAHISRFGQNAAADAMAEIVTSYAGIQDTDAPSVAENKLATAVRGLGASRDTSAWMLRHLRLLCGMEEVAIDMRGDGGNVVRAWRRFLKEIAAKGPVVVVMQDVHAADGELLDLIESLSDTPDPVSMFVIVTARPELFDRRPDWGSGRGSGTTITLDTLSDSAITLLWNSLVPTDGFLKLRDKFSQFEDPLCVGDSADGSVSLLNCVGGNPLFAAEYARELGSRGCRSEDQRSVVLDELTTTSRDDAPPTRALPRSIHNIIAAQLDTLTPTVKAVLHDAAVLGDIVWPGALAAMGVRSESDVVRCLEHLECRELLRRVRHDDKGGEDEYVFRRVLVRSVAYSQIPRSVRAQKHRRAAEWIRGNRVSIQGVR